MRDLYIKPTIGGDVIVKNSNESFLENVPVGEELELDDYEFEFQDEDGNVIDTEFRPAMTDETFIIGSAGLCPTLFDFDLYVNGVFQQVVTVDVNNDINININ